MEPLQNFIVTFLKGNVPFGSWKEHVYSWIESRGDDPERFLLVRFEDIKAKGEKTLQKIADFLSIDCTDEHIVSAVDNSRFHQMMNLEKTTLLEGHSPVVRQGKSTEWEFLLTEADIDNIWNKTFDLMEYLGYRK
jgi:estrone sulfotransferase